MRTRILGATLVARAAGDNLCLACVSSKAQLALTGSFGFQSGLCLPAGEPVPLSGNVHTTDFTLEPTNGCASVPLPVKFTLNFNRDRTLNAAASSVTVEE